MTENTLFPGRPNYTGPTAGWFGLLHHSELYEGSDNVMERVEYVKENKSPHEIPIRLHNMIYLGELGAKRKALDAEYGAKGDALNAEYMAKHTALNAEYDAKHTALNAEYMAKHTALNVEYDAKRAALYAEVLAYIRENIPDCAWDDNLKELKF